jgi:hypothetical protein
MSTGQSVLDRMEILHPELQLQTGESDVAKGLIAVNIAQDYFESILALHPGVLGDTVGTVTTTANQETTTYPTNLLRLDKLQYIDAATSRPSWDLDPLYGDGSHAGLTVADWLATPTATTGAPKAYWTNGRSLYWAPIPDATYTVRWYGFQQQTDLTASGTFQFPDICLTPIATFAVKAWRIGLDDATDQLQALAQDVFEPVVTALKGFRREGPKPLVYRYAHGT